MSSQSTFETYRNSNDPLFGGASQLQIQDYYNSISGLEESQIEMRNNQIINSGGLTGSGRQISRPAATRTFNTYRNSSDPLFGGANVDQIQNYYDNITTFDQRQIEKLNNMIIDGGGLKNYGGLDTINNNPFRNSSSFGFGGAGGGGTPSTDTDITNQLKGITDTFAKTIETLLKDNATLFEGLAKSIKPAPMMSISNYAVPGKSQNAGGVRPAQSSASKKKSGGGTSSLSRGSFNPIMSTLGINI